MAASAKFMIFEAERRFPVRIRIGVPPDGLGSRLDQIKSWLDANCGADVWAITPSRTRGVLNDAVSIYFADATLTSAFVARWCAGYKVETAGGDVAAGDGNRLDRLVDGPGPDRLDLDLRLAAHDTGDGAGDRDGLACC